MPVLFRRGTVTVDDTDPRYQYQGAWHEVTGSSRQWDAGVMATQQPGASVSFSFFGSNAILYQTIPSGSGTVVVDISVDGGDSATVTSACGGANPVYHNIFFSTQIMADITHTVIVTNKSPEEIPFQFDRADIQSHDAPSILPLQDANNVPPPVVVASQIPTSTPKEAPPTTPPSTNTATSIAAAPLGASLTGTFVGSHGVQITQTQTWDFSPPKGTASISESETTASNSGSALPDNASSASPPQVSALITVTTDSHGATLTHTIGTVFDFSPLDGRSRGGPASAAITADRLDWRLWLRPSIDEGPLGPCGGLVALEAW